MTAKEIAAQIPAEYRREILQTNIISHAMATNSDPNMAYLGIIWKNYIVPTEDLTCGRCLERILENFRQMQNDLIQLEKEYQLLNEL